MDSVLPKFRDNSEVMNRTFKRNRISFPKMNRIACQKQLTNHLPETIVKGCPSLTNWFPLISNVDSPLTVGNCKVPAIVSRRKKDKDTKRFLIEGNSSQMRKGERLLVKASMASPQHLENSLKTHAQRFAKVQDSKHLTLTALF
jgi:hypothetical protein